MSKTLHVRQEFLLVHTATSMLGPAPAPLQELELGNGLVSSSPAEGPQAGTREPVDLWMSARRFPKEHPRGLI